MSIDRKKYIEQTYGDRLWNVLRHTLISCSKDEKAQITNDWYSYILKIVNHNQKFVEWIIREVLAGNTTITEPSIPILLRNVETYQRIYGHLDINQFNIVDLWKFISQQDLVSTKEKKRLIKNCGTSVIYQDDTNTCLVINTHEACKLYCSNTRWCVAGRSSRDFDAYNECGPLILWILQGKKYLMNINILSEFVEIRNDSNIQTNILELILRYPIIKNILLSNYFKKTLLQHLWGILWYSKYITQNRNQHLEHLLTTPQAIYDYATEVIKGRFNEREHIILSEPSRISVNYIFNFIRERVPSFEQLIIESNDRDVARYYVRIVCNNNCPTELSHFVDDVPRYNTFIGSSRCQGKSAWNSLIEQNLDVPFGIFDNGLCPETDSNISNLVYGQYRSLGISERLLRHMRSTLISNPSPQNRYYHTYIDYETTYDSSHLYSLTLNLTTHESAGIEPISMHSCVDPRQT